MRAFSQHSAHDMERSREYVFAPLKSRRELVYDRLEDLATQFLKEAERGISAVRMKWYESTANRQIAMS